MALGQENKNMSRNVCIRTRNQEPRIFFILSSVDSVGLTSSVNCPSVFDFKSYLISVALIWYQPLCFSIHVQYTQSESSRP